jgi:hypothetical protein
MTILPALWYLRGFLTSKAWARVGVAAAILLTFPLCWDRSDSEVQRRPVDSLTLHEV